MGIIKLMLLWSLFKERALNKSPTQQDTKCSQQGPTFKGRRGMDFTSKMTFDYGAADVITDMRTLPILKQPDHSHEVDCVFKFI